MIVIYFSGTGNTKYVADEFAKKMNTKSYSIEEFVDFESLIKGNETITFCYPIYGSCVPRIMEEFVLKYKKFLDNRKLIILITQMMFSGDGARVFTDLLGGIKHQVIYAEHFNMPLNIPNMPVINVKNGEKLNKRIKKTDKKIDSICSDIKSNVIKKRGFNKVSKFVGYNFQRRGFSKLDEKLKDGVRISEDCVLCTKCVSVCPMHNLCVREKKIKAKGICTGCERCVNICPKQAITVLCHGKVKEQYKGIK